MHPILFKIGALPIGTYGLMLVLGFWSGSWLIQRLAVRDGHDQEAVGSLTIRLLIAGVLGAKVLLIIVGLWTPSGFPGSMSWDQVFTLDTLRAGGVVHGAILAGFITLVFSVRTMESSKRWSLGDAVVCGVALGQGLGRLGCLAAGCCHGTACDLPWAITFTNPLAEQYSGTPLFQPLHPTQIYMSLAGFVILGILLWVQKHRKYYGQVFALYFLLEGLARMILETWRGDGSRGAWFGTEWLSTGRFTGLSLIFLSILLYYFASRSQSTVRAPRR